MSILAKRPAKDFLIVGIGASAGGLEALKEFFQACPRTPGAAFVVVVHFASDFKSLMPDILSRATAMPVAQAADGMKVRVDRVYVIPPGKDMTIKGGVLRLAEREPGSLTIDGFLTSLAEDRRRLAVAVVLSGELSDGSRGVQAIKAAGGATFAQAPRSALHPHMPEAAAATGAVDHVFAPKDIARRLMGPAAAGGMDIPPALEAICAYLRDALHGDFSHYKKPTISRRVHRRMEALKLTNMEDYFSALKTIPGEGRRLSEDLLVHVTGFFRDPLVFDAVKAKVYPALFRNRSPKASIRVWIAGCSTGEEVYSHAINLLEYAEANGYASTIQVFGTDLDEGVLAKARRGFFSAKTVELVPPETLARYFAPVKGGFQITKAVRDLCVFAKHDVAKDAPFSSLDFISCRNLLIYLEPVLQKRVLSLFHYALKTNAFLLLGSSESVGESSAGFDEVDKKARLYAKTGFASVETPEFAVTGMRGDWARLPERRVGPSGTEPSGSELQAEVGRILLNQYTPAGVLVNDAMDIVQTHGSTSRFLELPSGAVSTNLAKMAHADLSLAIRAAIHKAKSEDVAVRKTVRVRLRDEELDVQVDVIPVKPPQDRRRRYLVLFSPLPKAAPDTRAGRTQSQQLEFQQLRDELDSAKDFVQSVTREQEASNRQKRAARDENASAVEEFHSMNEELEAAKEELQATNEELVTVNEELARRNAELRASHDEVSNLLTSAQIPILVLDNDMRIRRFTAAAETVFDLHRSDAGKQLTSLKLAVQLPDLKNAVAKVLRGHSAIALEVRDRQGRWYTLWIRPYQTSEKRVEGVALSLIDFTDRKNELLTLQYAEAALDTRKVAVAILAPSLKIIRANKLFYEIFRISARKAHSRTLFQLGKGMWNVRPLREKLQALSQDEAPFTNYECEFDVPARGSRTLSISGRAVTHGEGEEKVLVVTIDDVTPVKQAAEAAALRKSESHQRDFVANVSHELMTPITAIKGYAEALVGGALEVPGKRLKFTQIIEKHADRLTQLVEDLLQLSTSEAGHKKSVEKVPLAAQLKKLLMGLAPTAHGRGISIRVKVAPDLKVAVNKSELNQILQNLVANAIKYNRPKGRVAIAASVVGKRIIVSVQDTGIGVPKEDLTRIFDRFHRAANARSTTERGTGLGLSIVKSILAAHGCRIWAESSGGRGTTFFFTLPKG